MAPIPEAQGRFRDQIFARDASLRPAGELSERRENESRHCPRLKLSRSMWRWRAAENDAEELTPLF